MASLLCLCLLAAAAAATSPGRLVPYDLLYADGVRAYFARDWGRAAELLQRALHSYAGLRAARRACRAACRREAAFVGGPTGAGPWEAALFGRVLQRADCLQHCLGQRLGAAPSAHRASHAIRRDFEQREPYNYLQVAFFQLKKLDQAVSAAHTFFVANPQHLQMREDIEKYRRMSGVKSDNFRDLEATPHWSIQHYVQRSLMEKKLIYYGVEHLGGTFNDPDLWTPDELIPENLKEKHREDQEKQKQETLEVEEMEKRGPLPFEGIAVTMDSRQMNGTQRVVFDRVLTESECKDLLRLTKAAGEAGDGYRARRSPHTPHERFEGLTVLKATQLAQNGDVDWRDAKLLLQASEKSRRIIESYFTPGKKLHFSFTHLVCRTAVDEEQESRMDLSHPVHADNCLLDPEGQECWKEPPAYVYRDYSGILYLNDDFQGGGLFFTEMDTVTVTAEVHPKCGRLVAFSSGKENPHGVWAVSRGRRCAIALWYTHSQEHAEQDRVKAEELMEQRAVEQDRSDGKQHPGADHSGRSSSEPLVPNSGARPTSQRHKPGSDRTQHPKELRARDEF
ncbi:prolyl 3-hydroxylase 3 isoform X2 [Grus americana]|uniref:prolyl 3-hydroxylase 3 isoform X2 n=1 Tax=Grus americana TaxID=9117 RepID=UPI0024086F64|nr:prolyl 3-hydroxylase 3 isoform X2 [Grus americana]